MADGAMVAYPWAPDEVQRRLTEIQAGTTAGSPEDLELSRSAAAVVRQLINEQGVTLYAGTNLVSREVASAHDPWLGARAVCGLPGSVRTAGFAGIEEFELLEVLATRAVAETMRAQYADIRPQSATLANLAVFAALTPVGATLASLPAHAGSHFSHHEHGAAGIRGHRVVELPFDAERQDVDLKRLPALLAKERPALLILGGSVHLFPYSVSEISDAAHELGVHVMCDLSHPAGLIPGGAYPSPLELGADVMTFSTYKSYGGPPGGAVVTNDVQVAERVTDAIFPGLTANYDVSRLRPLHLAAADMLRQGNIYGAACVASARALAAALVAGGIPVMAAARGHTETNQVLVRMPNRATADEVVRRCAASKVFISSAEYQDELGVSAALRLGTQELVRRGLGPQSMEHLAGLLIPLFTDGTSSADLRQQVGQIREMMSEAGLQPAQLDHAS